MPVSNQEWSRSIWRAGLDFDRKVTCECLRLAAAMGYKYVFDIDLIVKNILLVQVVDDYGLNKFLPLAIAYQWLFAERDPRIKCNWRVADVLIEKVVIEPYVDSLTEEIHVVAMSCYVWNFNYNNRLAQAIKKRWPDCKIVVGGPEITKHDPDLIRNRPWFDLAVLGENESVLADFLQDLNLLRVTERMGVVTKFTHEIQQPERTKDLKEIPSPILSGFYDSIMSSYRAKGVKVDHWQVTWETMRGCPYHCAFCDIGDDYWNKTTWFDLDRVYKEIDWMGSNKIEYLSVCDSNWGIHPRDIEITKRIIASKQRTGYPRILDVTWAKNNPDRVRQIIELDQRAGTGLLRGLNMSLQSMDPTTLEINSRFNLVDSVLDKTLRWYKANNIPTFSEIIWPLPGETLESFISGIQHMMDIGQRDFVVVHPLVSTNNSPLGQAAFRSTHGVTTVTVPVDTFWMKIPDQESYVVETEQAVISTNTASYEDVLQGNMIAHWVGVLYYYGWAHYVMRYLRRVIGLRELDFIQAWIRYCESNPMSLAGREHAATLAAYRSVFETRSHWGRLLPEPFDNIYWEYKSGTCVVFQDQRPQLIDCMHHFLDKTFGLIDKDLVRLNFDLCVDHKRLGPFYEHYRSDVLKSCLDVDGDGLTIYHRDTELSSPDMDSMKFCARVYHHRRKMRHWHCDFTVARTLEQ